MKQETNKYNGFIERKKDQKAIQQRGRVQQ